mmetsp:Transcript_2059/g.4709  ORF Transcript_2059/g.4709 Transcript_2059/m.4709 type:complete len:315 (+) Transcript_2059:799-1743(+)
MSETWDSWMCGLTGFAFLVSSGYTFWKYNTYSLLLAAPSISLTELFQNKDKYLYRNVFLFGKASAEPPIKSVTSANYSSVIYSNYSSTRMNQQGLVVDQTNEKSTCYFKIGDREENKVEVRPTRETDFIGYDAYQASGYIELSWSQTFKSILGFLTVVLHRAIPFSVASRYESSEELIPNDSFVYVHGRIQSAFGSLFMFPNSVTLSIEELINPILRRIKVSACLQVFFGITFGYYFVKILRRRWRQRQERKRYENLHNIRFDGYECSICTANPRDVVFIPCRHLAICRHCDIDIERCPVCRSEIEDRFMLYFS